MIIGFSGTSGTPSLDQVSRATEILVRFYTPGSEFHHGDCVGSDEQIAQSALLIGYTIIGHPPVNERARAFFPSNRNQPPLPYLARNKVIAKVAEILLATPEQDNEKLRSGTWSTIRYARERKIPIFIVGPTATAIENN